MSFQLALKLLKVIYDLDEKADLGIRNIKQLTLSIMDQVKKQYKHQNDACLYFIKDFNNELINKIIKTPFKESQFSIQQYNDQFEESMLYCYSSSENQKLAQIFLKQSYITLLRTLAMKINQFNDRESQDIQQIIKILQSNIEKFNDLDIRIESLNILKALLIGGQNNSKIKPLNFSSEKKIELISGNSFSYIARVFDKKLGINQFGQKYTSQNYDQSVDYLSFKIAEEYILQEYMNFILCLIQENGINLIDRDYIRYFLLLFSKNSSSQKLAQFYRQSADLFCSSDLNYIQMILGQFQSENCYMKIIRQIAVNNLRPDLQLDILENDEKLLFGFKFLLFRILDQSSDVYLSFESKKYPQLKPFVDYTNSLPLRTFLENKDFLQISDIKLNKFDFVELYCEMMQSAQFKQSLINDVNNCIYTLYQPQVNLNCPITPQLIVPAFKEVFKYVIHQNHQSRLSVMQLFENTLLKQNPFPNYINQSKYVYLAEALGELLLEELQINNGYIMHPEKVYLMYKSNLKWGIGQIYLERMHFQRDKYILNQKYYNLKNFETSGALDCLSTIFDEMNENDYSYGLKTYLASSFELRRAIAIQQQRDWVDAQTFLKDNAEIILTDTQNKLNKENLVYFDLVGDYSQVIDQAIFKNLFIECQKNLNRWDELSEYAERTNNLQFNFECLFNTFNMVGLKKQLQTIGQSQINYENALKYHSHALVEFQRTTTDDSPNQKCEIVNSISIAFFHILKEWTKLPRNAQNAHIKHLVQLQALVELEEGQRVRDNREQQSNLGLIIENQAKNAQSTINQWRERMPHKFENLTTWKCITDQRNVILTSIFSRLKTRTDQFLRQLQKNITSRKLPNNPEQQQNNQPTSQIDQYIDQLLQSPEKIEKILAPYTDTRWNTLVFIKTQQLFGYNTIEKMPNLDERLHPEEIYLRSKLIASTYKYSESINNIKSSIEQIEKQASSNQQEDFKIHKADLYRKRALLQWQNNKYVESTEDMQNSLKICENYYKTWKSWLDICFQNYLKRQNQEYWIRNVFQLIPNALKYKPYKNQMLFTYALFILTLDKQPFIENIRLVLNELPKPQLLLWVPFLISQLYNSNKADDQESNKIFSQLLEELSVKYPQCIFYYLRAFIDENGNNNFQEGSSSINNIYENLKNTSHNSDLIKKMEIFADLISKPFLQNFEFENALREINVIFEDFSSPKDENQVQQFITKINNFLKQNSQFFNNNTFPFLQQNLSLPDLLNQIRTQIYNPLLKKYQETYISKEYQIQTGQSFTTEQLLRLSLNSQEIEIPGQYIIQQQQVVFKDYQPLNHVVISSINKGLRVQFKNRNITRQVIINGSNNKQYLYELQNGGGYLKKKGIDNYWSNQLRLQLIEQIQNIINIIFNLNKETFIRHLQIKSPKKFCLGIFSDRKYHSQYFGNLQIMLVPVISKTLVSLQDICDEQMPCQKDFLDSYNTHLSYLEINNDKQLNQKMKQILSNTALNDYFLQKVNDFMDYICIRKEITYNLSTAMFYNYFLGKSLFLNNIFVCLQTGKAYINYENIEINEQSQIIIKNHHSIRLSRCISQFVGDLGIQGVIAPTFISMAKALTRQIYPVKQLICLFLIEMVKANNFQQNQCNSDEFMEIVKKFYDKLLWIYVEDIGNNGKTCIKANNKSFNGLPDPIYPRSHLLMEVIQQNQNNNNNSIIYKYWF